MENKKDIIYFIFEFMEEFLSEWTYFEILQTIKYLKRTPTNRLIISNFQIIQSSKNKENQKYLKKLTEALKAPESNFVFILPKTIKQSYNNKTDTFIFTNFIINQNEVKIIIPKQKMCLLDLRGKKILSTPDKKIFQAFVFGGILGDNPPQDRTSGLRENFLNFRHLEKIQMSTDTAILVSDIILNENRDFKDIPMIVNPEFKNPQDKLNSVQMEGFTYVTGDYCVESRKVGAGGDGVIMNERIRDVLLFKEFEFDFGI